ncbi:hypothetical protein [Micromonospora avicenniae]|uniref:Uncharacterized protein n=1 Tax=Micromonospora avicenniae TaxID=1198245 RepID=A0A1N7BH65_9ACTN|nr:hypothetical protein [Micromonospora avicenniae]SIR50513.1 hypothetical protein SAMN05444858_1111 [Micromonospora avicenniae]
MNADETRRKRRPRQVAKVDLPAGPARELRDVVHLALLREQAGDRAGAEALAIQAADHGDTRALPELARMREAAGDRASAEALRRFGLADDGSSASSLD